jgi:uncharacterized iron-regulated protein
MKNTTRSYQRASYHRAPAANRMSQLWTIVLSASLIAASVDPSRAQENSSVSPAQTASACDTRARWIDLKTGQPIDKGELIGDLVAKTAVVLLGELHTDVDHHNWQLHTLAALHGRGGNIVIGFEAFPRRLQSVLNDWVEGKLTDQAFLKASEWGQVWGYDAGFYMPLFQFARLNRIPMIALNVERSLVARVGREGWEAVPPSEREGLSDPAPASPAYQRALARVYLMKRTMPREAAERLSSSREPNMPEPEEAALAEAMKEPEFKRFVEAQLTWDRAMAEALASANRKFSNATIVGVLGSGHVENGHGVPHQLKALGVTALTTLIPVSVDTACKYVGTSYADAVFTLPRSEETLAPARPRLGVLLMQGDGALRINRVVSGSVAEAAGLQAGDHVVRAAGLEMRNSDDLVEIVSRQAPGTWLPLGIRRDGQEIDLIAKFPTLPRQDR